MLAVNAGIEAKRAGPAGRGFGVVANQVGELSSTTGGAAKSVSEIVTELHAGLNRIQSTLKSVSGKLEQSAMTGVRAAKPQRGSRQISTRP